MRYVVVAHGQVFYCRTRAEAVHLARESHGRAYRADWTEVTEA